MTESGETRPPTVPAHDFVLTVTSEQAEALALLLSHNGMYDTEFDDLAARLSAFATSRGAVIPSPAASVFAAAEDVLISTRIDIAAEHEAGDVADAVAATEKSAVLAALTAAQAASRASHVKADAAAYAAQEVADTAADTAARIRLQSDALAVRVAAAAVEAADTVLASVSPGEENEAALTALRLAATVDTAATAAANETALAAAAVAAAVATAAAQAALDAATSAASFEREVARAAAAVKSVATTTARDLAVDTDAKAADVALTARRSSDF